MTAFHVAVWIDHKEAKIYEIDPEGFEVSKIKAPHQHLTRKAEEHGQHGDQPFFHQVAAAIEAAGQVLVVGPSSAKLEFIRHVHRHHQALDKKVVGVETLDHPTDGQLVAYVRHYFLTKIL
jgi:stalled ribosome rescue protein Dom34